MDRVRWTERADSDLARLWMLTDSDMRAAINVAVNSVERRLAKDPLSEGESRAEDERVAFEYPLGFSFRVDSQGFVMVGHVWSIVRQGF